MKFYMDLEATQFSGRIISIGAVSETGEKFYSLVKPYKEKVSDFITDLTGLTDKEVQSAPEPDLAFQMFSTWMNEVYYKANITKHFNPEFYFYGKEDKTFLEHTKTHMSNINSIMIVEAIVAKYNDYSTAVRKHFNSNQDISLIKVFAFCQEEKNLRQKHNALEDAAMLAYISQNLEQKSHNTEDLPKIAKTVIKPRKYAPELYTSWMECKNDVKWIVMTDADKNNYKYYATQGNNIQYFNTLEAAALWVMRFIAPGGSPKDPNVINKRAKKIKNSINNNNELYGIRWFINNIEL